MSCTELKSIQYKSMLLTGIPTSESKASSNMENLEKFLEDNKMTNQSEPWNKLNKTIKTKKLLSFADIYAEKNELAEKEKNILIAFLKDSLDRKRFQRVKDVVYDKENGVIMEIPALFYTKGDKHFTLKNLEKRVSTLRSLPPKKGSIKGTIKNILHDNEDSEEEKE